MQNNFYSCPIENGIARASKMRSLKKAEIINEKRKKLSAAFSAVLPFSQSEELLDEWLEKTDQREVNRTAEWLVANLK